MKFFGSTFVLFLAYVDKILLFGASELVCKVKQDIGMLFEVKDMGAGNLFLGVKITGTEEKISLSQLPLIEKLLTKTGMKDSKPLKCLIALRHILYEPLTARSKDEEQNMDSIPYREALVILLFLATSTRPDLSVSVSLLSKFASASKWEHWKAMLHVIRYLQGSKELCLEYT